MLQGIATATGTLLIIIVILILAYVCTKYMGRKGMRLGGTGSNSRYMKVIDRIILGQESSLALVQVSGKIYFLGVTGEQISLLTELAEEELSELSLPGGEGGAAGGVSFRDLMERMKDRKK